MSDRFTDIVGYTALIDSDEDRVFGVLEKKLKGFFDENSTPGMFNKSKRKSETHKKGHISKKGTKRYLTIIWEVK